jgi:hypothetical protein
VNDGEHGSKLSHAGEDSRLDRAHGKVELVRDLAVGHTSKVREIENRTLFGV